MWQILPAEWNTRKWDVVILYKYVMQFAEVDMILCGGHTVKVVTEDRRPPLGM